MHITGIPSSITAPLSHKDSFLKTVQAGQQLHIKVISQQPTKSEVILQIGKNLITAKSSIPTHVGQIINATVIQKNDEIILSVKPNSQPSDKLAISLRQLLPKQLPAQDIARLIKNPSSQQTLTQQVQAYPSSENSKKLDAIISQLVHSLANLKQITTANSLKTSLDNSGVFFEAALKKDVTLNQVVQKQTASDEGAVSKRTIHNLLSKFLPTALATLTDQRNNQQSISSLDTKANLVRLIALLKQWQGNQHTHASKLPQGSGKQDATPKLANLLPELLNKAEGSLAKLVLNQIASSPTDASSVRQSWHFDIPYFNGHTTEVLFLKVEQEQNNQKHSPEELRWTVSLELSPPKLGLIRNQLTLSGNQINSQFWAENSATGTLIKDHLKTLKSQLIKANLESQNLQVHSGPGPNFSQASVKQSIISEKV